MCVTHSVARDSRVRQPGSRPSSVLVGNLLHPGYSDKWSFTASHLILTATLGGWCDFSHLTVTGSVWI